MQLIQDQEPSIQCSHSFMEQNPFTLNDVAKQSLIELFQHVSDPIAISVPRKRKSKKALDDEEYRAPKSLNTTDKDEEENDDEEKSVPKETEDSNESFDNDVLGMPKDNDFHFSNNIFERPVQSYTCPMCQHIQSYPMAFTNAIARQPYHSSFG